MSQTLGPPRGFLGRLRHEVDWVIVTLTFGIVVLGLINLDSAGSGDWTGFVSSQTRYILLGSVVLAVAGSLDYRVYYQVAYPAYGVGLLCVLGVAIVGVTTNSAERWLRIGSFMFQPSEPMKILLVLAVARFLQDIPEQERLSPRGLLVPGLLALVPAAFIVRQPDLSTSVVLVLITISMLALTELTLRRLVLLIGAGVVSFMVAWRFLMEGYQQERVDVWLNPEAHAEGGGYQILQARTAVGNGGFLGRGAGQGTQNVLSFVPYKESDFVFVVFAEEWGFLGTALLLSLFLALVLWAINIASQARDRFGALLCAGVGALLFWHVVLNVGVVLEFFPNTGLPLPFFTHGGSNVVTVMFALGVLMSVSRSRHARK